MMMDHVLDAAHWLIDAFDLHRDGAPVDLWPLDDYFTVVRSDLSGTGTVAFLMPVRRIISVTTPATIVIDTRLDTYDTRLAYAHEIGHALLKHAGTRACLSVNEWFYNRAEREAWVFAGELLIPQTCVFGGGETNVGIIAGHCRVPRWLVEIYLETA